MKKRFVVMLLMLCLLAAVTVPSTIKAEDSGAESEYHIYLNKEALTSDYTPILHNSAVYVPLWSVLGQLKMSAEDIGGVLRINHPNRVLLTRADQNRMTYFGRNMEAHNVRLDYPLITKDYVMYAPLVFLADYLDMQISYGEGGRIDITSGNSSKNVSWGTKNVITDAAKQLKLDSDAEQFWSENPTLWNLTRKLGTKTLESKYAKNTVVSYSGTVVTLVNSEESYTLDFSSMDLIKAAFATSDPLGDFDWSEETKDLIRHGYAKVGMNQEMALYAWGKPTDVNKYNSKYIYTEQWVYRTSGFNMSYLYFDASGLITSISN